MNKDKRLGVILILCLIVLAGRWPIGRVTADQHNLVTANHYYFPRISSTSLFYFPYVSFVLPPPPPTASILEAVGPDGGGVTSVLLNPKNPQIAYAGTWGAGVFKSLDGGKTWESASIGLENLYVQSMVIDPVHPEIIYAGTYRSGVYKTINGGTTWVYAGKGLNTDAIVYALAIDPITPTIIYAGTRSPGSNPPWGGGVYKSTDGGQTWANSSYKLSEDWVYGLAVSPSNTQTLYAATHSQGVFKSTNGGNSWAAVNNGVSDHSMRTVAIDPSNTQVVYAGCWHTTGVFKTTNGGQSWTTVSNGLNGAKIISITVDPVHPQTVYALSYLQGVYKTDNGGGNWSMIGLWPDYVFNLTVDPTNRQALLASAENVDLFRSTNGGASWVNSGRGLHATDVTAVAADQNLPGVVYAGMAGMGVYQSKDSGQNWTSANAGLGDLKVRSLALVSGSLYVGTDSGGIYKTAAVQADWHAVNSGLPKGSAKTPIQNPAINRFNNLGPAADLFLHDPDNAIQPKAVAVSVAILALAPAPSAPTTLYAGTGGSGLYRTTDAGSNWQAVGLDGKTLFSVMVDRSDPLIIYAGTDAANGSLLKSLDGGAHWGQIKAGMEGVDVLSLSQDPFQKYTIYAGTNQGVFKSIDVGANWTRLGLDGQSVYALSANPHTANSLAAGTTAGLFISHDGGGTWTNIPGLINPEVWCLAFGVQSTDSLFIGTNASGLYHFHASPSN
jgi:photosystem II stability/assembly factor-like uncharacterized protein